MIRGRAYKGQPEGVSGPCGSCCAPGTICSPKGAARGDLTLKSWSLSTGPLPEQGSADFWQHATSRWTAQISFESINTGLAYRAYRYVFEQDYIRTFTLPSIPGAPGFWAHPVNYFSEAVPLFFEPSDIAKIYYEPQFGGEQELLPNTSEAARLQEVLGGDPFAVRLSVWPIDSTHPYPQPGAVPFPSDFSIAEQYPQAGVHTRPHQEHLEMAWASNHLTNHLTGDNLGGWANWGRPVETIWGPYTEYFTSHPRGWTLLTQGLGPLDAPIHEFQDENEPFTAPTPYNIRGACGDLRYNEFFDAITVTISGWGFGAPKEEWDGGNPTPQSDAQWNIQNGLNGVYVCEWVDNDSQRYKGRNEHWTIRPSLLGLSLTDFDTATEGNQLTTVHGPTISFNCHHGAWGLYMDGRTISGTSGSMTKNAQLGLAGVLSYQQNGRTYPYISNPTDYIRGIASQLTWTVLPPNEPATTFAWRNEPVVLIS